MLFKGVVRWQRRTTVLNIANLERNVLNRLLNAGFVLRPFISERGRPAGVAIGREDRKSVMTDSKEGDIRMKKAGVLGRLIGVKRAQTMTEYSLIVMFVGLAAFSAYEGLGVAIKSFSTMVLNFINAAVAQL